MRRLAVYTFITLLLCLASPSAYASPVETLLTEPACAASTQGMDYCMCLIYRKAPGPPPVPYPPPRPEVTPAVASILYRCMTDTTASTVAPNYPKGLIPYVTYKGLKDSGLKTVFSQIIIAFLTLAVAIFGMRVTLGHVSNLKTESIYLLFKIAGVMYFVSNAPDLYISMIKSTTQLTDAITKTSTPLRASIGNGITNFWNQCTVKPVDGTPLGTAPTDTAQMWGMWDCMLNYLIGFAGNNTLLVGILGFASLLMYAMPTGIFIMILIMYAVGSIIKLFMMFMQTYLLCILALSFMFVIGFMFVPLIVFRGTYTFFLKWVNMCFSFILTPMMMMGFMTMCLVMFDVVLFTGDNSLFEKILAGTKSDFYHIAGSDPGIANPISYADNTAFRPATLTQGQVDHYNKFDPKTPAAVVCNSVAQPGLANSMDVTQTGGSSYTNATAGTARTAIQYKALNFIYCAENNYKCDPLTHQWMLDPALTGDSINNLSPAGCTPLNVPGRVPVPPAPPPPAPPTIPDCTVAPYNTLDPPDIAFWPVTNPQTGDQGIPLTSIGGNAGLYTTTTVWKYISGILYACAAAALMAYAMLAIMKYLPRLVQGIVSQGSNVADMITGGQSAVNDLMKKAQEGLYKTAMEKTGSLDETLKKLVGNRNK